jgi:alpha-tubulin suppressor-like RCC1 family protein
MGLRDRVLLLIVGGAVAWAAVALSPTPIFDRLGASAMAGRFDRLRTPLGTLAAGDHFGAAAKADGSLWVWGANGSGQLGIGTTVNAGVPVRVGAANDWTSVACGGAHMVALKADGSLWSWGSNDFGQLGNAGSGVTSPVRVGTANDWVAVAAGLEHTVALKADGSLWTWGNGTEGQLGDGSKWAQYTPTRIGTANDWIAVACGGYHTLALKTDGSLWACGLNHDGQLGDNSITDRNVFTRVGADNDWVTVAGGTYHSVAVKADGSLWAWGWNEDGALGDGTTTDRYVPTRAGSANDWIWVTAGYKYTLARKADGSLWATGFNMFGQLGDGSTSDQWNFERIGAGNDWADVVAGDGNTFGLKADGSLWSWGTNQNGALGVSAGLVVLSPTAMPLAAGSLWASPQAERFDAGYLSSFMVKSDGSLWAWGNNLYGELGDGTTTRRLSPKRVGSVNSWTAVAAGDIHTLALRADGTLWAWGGNINGQLGDGSVTPRYSPAQVGSLTTWVAIAAGGASSLGLTSDGYLWAWGDNSSGQLGDGTTTGRPMPTRIGSDHQWVAIGTGLYHSFGVKADGSVWAWGRNLSGQLGIGSTTSQSSPARIGTASDWPLIVAGGYHCLAVRAGGALWAWGMNGQGQLGDGTLTDRTSPTSAYTSGLWRTLSAGNFHSLATRPDGSLYAWGDNTYGQLGDGGTSSQATAKHIGAATDWVQLAGGDAHSLGLKANGEVLAWGRNDFGQIGLGTSGANVTSPTFLGDFGDPFGPPILSVTSSTHPDPAVWYTSRNASFSWAAGSHTNGNLGYSYVIDHQYGNAPPQTNLGTGTSTSFSGLADGHWYLHVAAVDKLGNWSVPAQLGVGIDNLAPVTTPSRYDALWHSAPVSVRLTASDVVAGTSTAGVAEVRYKIDDGVVQVVPSTMANAYVDAPAGGSNDGVHTVWFRALDRAGNLEAWKSVQVKIDTTLPQMGALMSPAHPSQSLWYRNASPLFRWAGLDDASAATVDAVTSVTGVDASGDLACVVDGDLLRVIDLTNPWRPQASGSVALDAPGYDVTMAGGFAYVADGEAGLLIVDLTDPRSPQVAAGLGLHAIARHVEISGTVAYVATDGGLFTVGLDGGVSPALLGAFTDEAVHAVAVQGTLAYAATGRGLLVLDVTDPARPRPVGECRLDAAAVGVSVSGATALVADGEAGLAVVDVSEPADPGLLIVRHTAGTSLGVAQAGAAACVADGAAGLTVYDVSGSPPLLAGTHDTAGAGCDVALSGEYALIADGTQGLAIVKAILTPSYSGVLDAVSGTLPPASGAVGGTSLQLTGQADGAWYVHVRMCDQAGNFSSAAAQYLVRIDTTAPQTADNAGAGWHAGPWTLQLSASDPPAADGSHSGMTGGSARTQYSTNGGTTWVTAADLRFARWRRGGGSGVHTVLCRSTDAAGNVETPRTATVRIDNSRPTSADDAPATPQSGAVTVHLLGHDAYSGVAAIGYSLDGGVWTEAAYSGDPGVPVSVSGVGAHTLRYYAVDGIGNMQAGYRDCLVTISSGGAVVQRTFERPHPDRTASLRPRR